MGSSGFLFAMELSVHIGRTLGIGFAILKFNIACCGE
jgi:hypothetical protein